MTSRAFVFGVVLAEAVQEAPTSITAAFIAAFSVLIGLVVWTIREDRKSIKDIGATLVSNQENQKVSDERLERVLQDVHEVAQSVQELNKVIIAIHDDYQSLAMSKGSHPTS